MRAFAVRLYKRVWLSVDKLFTTDMSLVEKFSSEKEADAFLRSTYPHLINHYEVREIEPYFPGGFDGTSAAIRVA